MKRISFLVALALMLSCTAGVYAQYDPASHGVDTEIDISVTISEHDNASDPNNWIISLKAGDYPSTTVVDDLDTSAVQLQAMGSREAVLGKVYMQLRVYDIYQVVVYTNEMDCDSDPSNAYTLPWNWGSKDPARKEDFISRHSGLQNRNEDYRDNEGFAILYGASLKVRSEGIHGYSTGMEGAPANQLRYDSNGDGNLDANAIMMPNASIPAQLWDAKEYEAQVQFSPIPEIAIEKLRDELPLNDDGTKKGLVAVAGSLYGSPLSNSDGTPNYLELIFGASEENTGSDLHSTTVYFDLRWN